LIDRICPEFVEFAESNLNLSPHPDPFPKSEGVMWKEFEKKELYENFK